MMYKYGTNDNYWRTYKCFEKSKRELGRALLTCPFAGATGVLGILMVYLVTFRPHTAQ